VTAWQALAEFYLSQGRWPEFGEALRQKEECKPDPVEGLVMWARGNLARWEFGSARELLGEAIRQAPQAVWRRVVLSNALLQEEADLEAAEHALRDVLAQDPENAEARQNLEVLRRQQAGRAGERSPAANRRSWACGRCPGPRL
jgi:tetratricopeptide (TPR) repeat protein